MTFWGGSGSADPCLWLVDPDPGSGSCSFHHWPSRCKQKANFILKGFSAYYFLKVLLLHIIFQRYKAKKKSPNSINQGFSYYFCLMIEESGSGSISQRHGSADPDPQHWEKQSIWSCDSVSLKLTSAVWVDNSLVAGWRALLGEEGEPSGRGQPLEVRGRGQGRVGDLNARNRSLLVLNLILRSWSGNVRYNAKYSKIWIILESV